MTGKDSIELETEARGIAFAGYQLSMIDIVRSLTGVTKCVNVYLWYWRSHFVISLLRIYTSP